MTFEQTPDRAINPFKFYRTAVLEKLFDATSEQYWQPADYCEWPAGTQILRVEIEFFDEQDDGLILRLSNGATIEPTPEEMARLCRAVRIPVLKELEELLFRPFTIAVKPDGNIAHWYWPDQGDVPTDAVDTIKQTA